MRDHPETQFAWNGEGGSRRTRSSGEGQPDLVYFPGLDLEPRAQLGHPIVERFLRGLARSRRLIIVDPRGMGVSERSSPHRHRAARDDPWTTSPWCSTPSALRQRDVPRDERLGIVANMFAATYPKRTLARDRVRDERELAVVSGDTVESGPRSALPSRGPLRRTWSRAAAHEDVRECDAVATLGDHEFARVVVSSVLPSGTLWLCHRVISEVHAHPDIRPLLASIHRPRARPSIDPGNPEPSSEPSAATWPITSPEQGSARYPDPIPSLDRRPGSGAGAVDEFLEATRLEQANSIACLRPSSSSTSWRPRRRSSRSAIATGETSSSGTERWFVRCSRGTAAQRWIPRVMASSPRLTAQHAPSARARCGRSLGSRCAAHP